MQNTRGKFLELKTQGKLPSIKGVALSLLEASSREGISLSEIAKIITPDPALTARLIKISNSVLFPGTRPVASLSEAISKIGTSQVRQVALSFSLVSDNKEGACVNFDYPRYWCRSILRASVMRRACLALRMGSADELFALGLLSRIGDLALATAYPEKYSALMALPAYEADRLRIEREAFGLDSTDLCSALMEDWKIPAPFVLAAEAARGKGAESCPPRSKAIAELLSGADQIASAWLDAEDPNEESFRKALGNLAEKMLSKAAAIGELKASVDEEGSCELADGAVSDAGSWMESLSLKAPARKVFAGGVEEPSAPRSEAEAESEAGSRSPREILMGSDGGRVPVRAMIGSADPAAIKTLAQAFSLREGSVKIARSKASIFEDLVAFAPHALFLDYAPTEAFANLLGTLRETELWRETTVILICSKEEVGKMPAALAAGADDYIERPFSLAAANAKACVAEKMAAISKMNKDAKNALRQYSLELESMNKKLLRASVIDGLTGLPNRALFKDRLGRALAASTPQSQAVLALVDLDNFKLVNDEQGHAAGDDLLRHAAEILRSSVKSTDTVARLGGDEFAMILRGFVSPELAVRRVEEIRAAVSKDVFIHGKAVKPSVSIGVATYPSQTRDMEALLGSAGQALQKAKDSGTGRVILWEQSMGQEAKKRQSIEAALDRALGNEEFEVWFQPRIELATRKIAGAEALLRWNSPKFGMVSPDQFIPIAEETSAIEPIGAWVLNESLKIAKKWRRTAPEFHIAVNISARQFESRFLPKQVSDALALHGLPPEALELEVTESCAMADVFHAAKQLEEIKRIGCSISIDDFGTGYSSLGYLKKLPFDLIKIDKSFIINALGDKDDRAICQMIASLAKSMGKGLVSEGIETERHAELAAALGSKWGQGYYYARPVPEAAFEKLLSDGV